MAQLVRAPPCHGGGREFESLLGRLYRKIHDNFIIGIIAQLGEHLPYKQRVIGSSPIGPTYAAVAELADAQDLKSCGTYTPVPVRFRFAAWKRFTLKRVDLFFYYYILENQQKKCYYSSTL